MSGGCHYYIQVGEKDGVPVVMRERYYNVDKGSATKDLKLHRSVESGTENWSVLAVNLGDQFYIMLEGELKLFEHRHGMYPQYAADGLVEVS